MTRKTAIAAWLLLIAVTVLSWWLAGNSTLQEQLTGRATEHAVIVGLAIAKMYVVMAIFMGLVRAPLLWHFSSFIVLLVIGSLMTFFVVA